MSFDEGLNLQKLTSNQGDAGGRVAILGGHWGVVYRSTDRARRRFLRSEAFRSHAAGGPRPFESDAHLAAHSGDEDPPELADDLERLGAPRLGGSLLWAARIFPLSWTRARRRSRGRRRV